MDSDTTPGFWQGLAEKRAAAAASGPDLDDGEKRKRWRCAECGLPLRGHALCGVHPDVPREAWPQSMKVAYALICRWGSEARDLERYIERVGAGDIIGTSRGELAMVLLLARKWRDLGLVDSPFIERDLPELATPRGLFG